MSKTVAEKVLFELFKIDKSLFSGRCGFSILNDKLSFTKHNIMTGSIQVKDFEDSDANHGGIWTTDSFFYQALVHYLPYIKVNFTPDEIKLINRQINASEYYMYLNVIKKIFFNYYILNKHCS